MDIATYIKDLLCRYNGVVVPNLGAFEWRYFPAKINGVEHQIQPPTYKLFFNSKHSHDADQLLVAHVAAIEGIDENTAQEAIVDYRLQLEKSLKNNKSADLEGLGTITVDNRGKATFIPHQQASTWAISPASGLPILDCSPILRDKNYLVPTTIPQPKKKKRKVSPILIGSLVVLALGAGSTPFWIHRAFPSLFANNTSTEESTISILPLMTESQEKLLELISAYRELPFEAPENEETLTEVDVADENSETTEESTNTEENSNEIAEVDNTEENNTAVVEEPEVKEEATVTPPPATPPPSSTEIRQGDYIIVIGVFGVQTNVDRNARLLQEAGYRTQIKTLQSGYTRVAAVVNCSTQQELQEKWANIRNQFTASAWIAEQ